MNLIDTLLLQATQKTVRTLLCAMQRALQAGQAGQHRECNQAYIEYYKKSKDVWLQNDFSATKLAILLDYTALGAASQSRLLSSVTGEPCAMCPSD